MGLSLFGVDIQAVVADALGAGDFPDATLVKITEARDPSTGVMIATSTSYATRGMTTSSSVESIFGVKNLRDDQIFGAVNVQGADVVIVLVAKPLADAGVEPAKDDRVITQDGVARTVVAVRTNDARATYMLQAR